MEQMKSVDVEEIMKQIRAEIAEKGYSNEMLSFEDAVVLADPETGDGSYNKNEYLQVVDSLNRCAHVAWYRDLGQGGVKTFFKKVIRKLNVFLIAPMSDEQNFFNARTVQAINQITKYMDEQDKRMKEQEEEIQCLKKKIIELEKEKNKGDE